MRFDSLRILAAAAALVIGALLMVQLARTGAAVRQQAAWIPSIGASYALGFDGLSAPLVLLTTLLGLLVLFDLPASGEDLKELLFLFLTMETGVLGVFLASDLLLFYVFWEVALVPLYFIIGIWGHEGRREAALKFFLYTRAGSLALLLAILALYFRAERAALAWTRSRQLAGRVGPEHSPPRPARVRARLRREGADRAVTQLAPRCACRGTDGGQRDARGCPAEDGRVRIRADRCWRGTDSVSALCRRLHRDRRDRDRVRRGPSRWHSVTSSGSSRTRASTIWGSCSSAPRSR